jgi:hypothetical protein
MLPAVSRLCGLYHQPHAAQSRLQTHKGLPGVKNDRADSRLIAKALTHRGIRTTKLASDEVQPLRTLSRYLQSLKAKL